MDLYRLINEVEFKFQSLPDGYFREYFEKDFLLKLKNIHKKLQQKANIDADSLKEVELLNEFRKII